MDGGDVVLVRATIRVDDVIVTAERAVYDETTSQVRLEGDVRMMSALDNSR